MKIKYINVIFSLATAFSQMGLIMAECKVDANAADRNTKQLLQLTEQKKSGQTLVKFNYVNENLINIINELAEAQGINILFPTDLQKIEFNVTLNRPNKITIQEAWCIVNTFLDIMGYALVPRGLSYEITLNRDMSREALDTYINIHPDQLPNDDRKIKYLYYLQNINLSSPTGGRNNLETILRDMLPGIPSSNNIKSDTKANCLILISRADAIKSAMQIVIALDKEGFREAIEIIPLKHTNAGNIVKLLNELIQNKSSSQQYRYGPYGGGMPNTGPDETYFAKNTNVVAIERNNAVAIMGKTDSVNKIKNFISKYLDIAVDANKAILHTKELQYLEAEDLAKILQRLVKAKVDNMQASSSKDALSEVIITAEKTSKAETLKQLDIIKDKDKVQTQNPTASTNQYVSSSNSLIVAAREPEWQTIEALINEIDQPQPQIIIETLIVDLSISDNSKLASQLRNVNQYGNPQAFNFQSSQIGGPVLNYSGSPLTPTTNGLASDLLSAGQLSGTTVTKQLAGLVDKGSTLISFNDGDGIAALLSLFKGQSNAKVLSQPFMTTLNNKQTSITLSDKRIVAGAVSQQSTGGPVILKNDTITADLKLDILPRISRTGTVNLEIIVHASEFQDPGSEDNNTILTRKIQTNANVSDQQVLVIGGLTKISDKTSKSGLPIISKIPIIGNLFKKRSQLSEKTTLMVFISPKIIQPRTDGINDFTQNQLSFAKRELVKEDRVFDNLSDPITRILFSAKGQGNSDLIQDFSEKTIFEDNKKNGAISKAIQ